MKAPRIPAKRIWARDTSARPRTRGALSSSVLLATLMVLAPGAALADGGVESDVRALEKRLAEEHAALSTADCNAACRALMSIRRAADKICALEPGPRCDAAREKASDATRRVQEACPDCVIATVPVPSPHERAAAPEPSHDAALAQESAPSHGGCRSCSTTGSAGSGEGTGLIVLAAAAAVRLVTRSKKDRRRL
jgi:MYXO-CTERM domain-containing protein